MIEQIGIAGAVIILLTFLFNQRGSLSADSFLYDFLNLIGSGALVYYAFEIRTIPFLLINTIWAITSLKDTLSWLSKKKRTARRNSL